MTTPTLSRGIFRNVTLLGDANRPGGVTLAFTERTGGVSTGPFSSLNLDDFGGDDEVLVRKNRLLVLDALGIASCAASLVTPRQVHGHSVVVVPDGSTSVLEQVRGECAAGADAVVCTAEDVPVLLRAADCALVVLVAQGGFAVAHSGWRGTYARISARALAILCAQTGEDPSTVRAYVGPHIGVDDYVVSNDLARQFADEFGEDVLAPGCRLSLATAIAHTLHDAGVSADNVAMCTDSTASNQDRYFSYRASGGLCGRHGAIACRFSGTPRDVWHNGLAGEVWT